MRGARAEGLEPSDYHFRDLDRRARELNAKPMVGMAEHWTSAPAAADFEAVLTDAFLLLAAHYADGKVDQDAKRARWHSLSRRVDPVEVLNQ